MKRMIKTVCFLATLGIVISCNDLDKSTNETMSEQSRPPIKNAMSIYDSHKALPSNDIYMNAANEACNCLQPIVEKVKHLKESELNKQTIEKKKTAAEIEMMQPQIQKCSDEISLKYRKMNQSIDVKRILTALIRQCPDASALFTNLTVVK